MSSATLVLVPTARELAVVESQLRDPRLQLALCGFGPIAAAARASALIAIERPVRVVLVGIAGTFVAADLPIGTATQFSAVALDGVGAGEGATLRSPAAIGFAQWQGPGDDRVDDVIHLSTAASTSRQLLTVCAASDGMAMANHRRLRFPAVVAEDMEGFGVALACQLARVPLTIIRGISNQVGDRNPRNWQIDDALTAATELASCVLNKVTT